MANVVAIGRSSPCSARIVVAGASRSTRPPRRRRAGAATRAARAPESPPPAPPTAYPTTFTPAGHLATDVGCAAGTSAAALDAFFRERIGPVLGHDYQHVYPLGGDRYLWLFQDTFIDHPGAATSPRPGRVRPQHGDGAERRVLHVAPPRHRRRRRRRSSPATASDAWRSGSGRWAASSSDGQLYVFWAEMEKDRSTRPRPTASAGIPVRTWLATYDAETLAAARRSSRRRTPAWRRSTATPWPATPTTPTCSATRSIRTWPARAASAPARARRPGCTWPGCRGGSSARRPSTAPATGGRADPGRAVPIVQRYWAENPMQPRYLDGQWVAATKVDGYWGERAGDRRRPRPVGSVDHRRSACADAARQRSADEHLPRPPDAVADGGGLVVSVSQNARDMPRDAWPPRPLPAAVLRRGDAAGAIAPHEPVDAPSQGGT